MIPGLFVLAGCGVSVHVSTGVITKTTSTTSTGTSTFSARGMAIHFQYPAAFTPARINSIGRKAESVKHVVRVALSVGSSGYDLLILTRYVNIQKPVTHRNLASQKRLYDADLSHIFARRMVSSAGTLGGMPALTYPDAPTPGIRASATTRAMFLFTGRDEYELQCQWTTTERATVLAACDQMRRTVHT